MTRTPVGSAAARMVAALALGLVVAGCGPAGPTTSPSVVSPPAVTPTTAATPTVSPAATAGPTVAPAGSVEEDESLLAVLPEDVEGTPLDREALAFAESSHDPAFAASIGSAVFFVAPGPEDLVSGLVARPRDGVFGDDWFRDWRETYDEGACGQAGGIGGRAEAAVDGRQVHITTCAGGMRVYHAWVEEQGVVVSLIALGDSRWGEQVMGTLRP